MLLIHDANNTTTKLHIASVKSNTNEQRYMAKYISPDQFHIHTQLHHMSLALHIMQTHIQQSTKKYKPRTRILQQPETTYTSNTSNSNVNGSHHP